MSNVLELPVSERHLREFVEDFESVLGHPFEELEAALLEYLGG